MKGDEIIVVNNFFKDPLSIRNWALNQAWEKKKNTPFECRSFNSPGNIISVSKEKIFQLIGDNYSEFDVHSEFLLYTKADELKNKANGNWIHSDRCDYVGIVFLSPLPPIEAGLSFYKHRATGVSHWSHARDNLVVQSQLKIDSAEIDRWIEIHYVQNEFNKLVLFNSLMFHQAKSYFGESIQDGRLTLNFYI